MKMKKPGSRLGMSLPKPPMEAEGMDAMLPAVKGLPGRPAKASMGLKAPRPTPGKAPKSTDDLRSIFQKKFGAKK